MIQRFGTCDSRREVALRLLIGMILASAALYFYLWWVMDVVQLHHDRRREFVWGFQFFRRFLGYVGGPLEYVYALLVQLWAFPWVGTAVFAAIFAAIYVGARRLMAFYVERPAWLFPLLPTSIALVLVSTRMTLVPIAAVAVAVYAALAYIWLPTKRAVARLALFLVSTCLLFYTVGGGVHLFIAICAIHELTARRRLLAVAIPASGALTPLGIRFLLYEPDLLTLYFRNAPIEETVQTIDAVTVALYGVMWASFPVAIAMAAVEKSAWRVRLRERLSRQPPMKWITQGILVAGVVAAFVIPPIAKSRLTDWTVTERLVDQGKWDAALDHVADLRERDMTTTYQVNRALFKEGRLLEEMFCYSQLPDAEGLLLDRPEFDLRSRTSEKRSAAYLDLGAINRAERWTLEAMSIMGELPQLVKRMVIINMVKRRPGAATIYLGRLKQMPFQSAWVMGYERKLREDPLLEHDAEIKALRACMFKVDYVDTLTSEELLGFCLSTNPMNRMAFEYIMATYLLTCRPDRIVANIGLFQNFGVPKIPRHCEEAILSFARAGGQQIALPAGYSINPETAKRYDMFLSIYNRYIGNPSTARGALISEFGDTYWFFEAFGRSGKAFAMGVIRE
jgi:hypothetical protein